MSNCIQIISTTIAMIVSIIGFFQWLDIRKREERNRRYDQFRRAFEWLAGRTVDGQPLVDTQQAMAVYELATFPEYRDICLPILDHYLIQTEGQPDASLFHSALISARKTLTKLN